jgi:hypothetical protein
LLTDFVDESLAADAIGFCVRIPGWRLKAREYLIFRPAGEGKQRAR